MLKPTSAAMAPEPKSKVFDKETQYAIRRQAILKEAGRVFEQEGPEGFSMTALASRLNITTPALYYYFQSKQEMLYECYRSSLNIAEMALATAQAEGGTPADVLEGFIYHYLVQGFVEVRPTMVLRDHISLNAKFQELLVRQREALHTQLRALVADGIAQGVILPCNPKLFVSSVTGMAAMVIRSYDPQGELSGEEVAMQIVRLLTGGFRSEAPAAMRRRGATTD